MIKILGICGSRVKDGNMAALLKDAMSHGSGLSDVETDTVFLADKDISGCNHCNWCIVKQTPDRPCVQEDDMGPIYDALLRADAVIMASPAHFGRLSGLLANMIDRTRAFVHGNLFHTALKNKVGGAMAVAFFRNAGIETTLSTIDIFFLTHQMIVAAGGMCQLGAGAYSSRDGKGEFEREPRHIVTEDEYGLRSARMLIDRVVELARIIKAGEAALRNGDPRS